MCRGLSTGASQQRWSTALSRYCPRTALTMFSSDLDLRLRCDTVSASSTRPPMPLNGCARVGAPSLAAKRFRMRATSPLHGKRGVARWPFVHLEDEAAPLIAAELHDRRLVGVGAAAVEIGHVLDVAPEHLEASEVGASGVALRLGLHEHRGARKQALRLAVARPHRSDEPAAVFGGVVARRDGRAGVPPVIGSTALRSVGGNQRHVVHRARLGVDGDA
eukprot:scaffold19032_cov66-Phaeocystis_antarctica.AAC.2